MISRLSLALYTIPVKTFVSPFPGYTVTVNGTLLNVSFLEKYTTETL